MQKQKYSHSIVGKKLGQWVWFHIDYLSLLTTEEELVEILGVRDALATEANIVKLNLRTRQYQLIHCPLFDEDNEPALAYTFDGSTLNKRHYRNNPPVFHQKHLFVRPDYPGFDVLAAEERTRTWKRFVQSVDNGFYLKIGRQNYWNAWLKENGLALSC